MLQSHENIATAAPGYGNSNGALVAAFTGTVAKVPLLRLLPALPSSFASVGGGGYVKGLLARGGFEVDVYWDASGALTSACVTSKLGGTVYVTLGDTAIGKTNGTALASSGSTSSVFLKLNTQAGKQYTVTKA
jgi:alpha-L-fucosidase 2